MFVIFFPVYAAIYATIALGDVIAIAHLVS